MTKIILSVFSALLCLTPVARASDFPSDPPEVKVLDRNYYVAEKPWIYTVLYDKGSDRVLEVFLASETPDGSTTWKSVYKNVYRKNMDKKFLDSFPFEMIYIGEEQGKPLDISIVGMLETDPALTITCELKTGACKEEVSED